MNPPADSNSTAAASGRSNLFLRIASALLLLPIVLGATWFGGIFFGVFVGIGGVLVLHEWCKLTNVIPSGIAGAPSVAAFLIAQAIVFALLLVVGMNTALVAFAVVAIAAALIGFAGTGRFWLAGGILYSGLPVIAAVALRADTMWGLGAVVLVFVVVWATDIAAYFCGRAIGGPKLWPKVSPKKTWAGAIGGAAAAIASSAVVGSFFGFPNMVAIAVLALVVSIAAQAGDLLESSIKRGFGAKDSGDLIPGHGGIMDRVDGLITGLVAAAVIGYLHGTDGQVATGLVVW